MSETLQLTATKREAAGKDLNRSRKAGLVPVVLYGHGIQPEMYWVNGMEFSKVFRVAGESTILSFATGKGASRNVLVHDVQLDPLSNRVAHVDLYQVRMDEELEAHVPLELINEAPAVRELGGVLVKTLEEVEIKCLPKDLPHSLVIDLAKLATFDDQIKVSDLTPGKGVVILTEADTVLALVEAPRTAADLEALDTKVEIDVTKVEGVVKETPDGGEEKK